MNNIELWKIIVGIITAIFLLLIKDAHSKANKQKIVATKFNAYLIYWRGIVLDNDWFEIFYIGVKWNNEEKKIRIDGGDIQDILKLKTKYKDDMNGFKEFLLPEISKLEEQLLKRLPLEYIELYDNDFIKIRQNIIDGKTFITDEEASCLGYYNANNIISFKMELVSVINALNFLILSVSSKTIKYNFTDNIDDIIKLFWQGIIISKHIDHLSNEMDKIAKQNHFKLVVNNFLK